jgi:hypothetical protein
MSSSYEALRSLSNKSLHVIIRGGGLDALPHRIRCLGPWQGLYGGEINRLKAQYRLQVAEQGFCVVYEHLASFSAER